MAKKQFKKYTSQDKGVTAKKHLGQHFLKDESIAVRIADCLTYNGYDQVLEIGPGTGVLTKHVIRKGIKVTAMELDSESVVYLKHSFPIEHQKIVSPATFEVLEADFLKQDLSQIFGDEPFAIVGNFPYNISTQIVFKTIENREQIPEFGGMFQKEVAQRICADHGSKTYGILSVLTQAYYDADYLFTVGPEVFDPPPRVHSGVLLLTRKQNHDQLSCSYDKLRQVVKLAFQQRRKTLRNSLKSMNLPDEMREQEIFSLRPEQISVDEFVKLTTEIEEIEKSQ
ncbi:16S rRNA (adenine(1518)-N(6)/adenine(1519)-N(6))-dimethyltransferase RsmA [Nonlabens ponticola]|uniref:Ribosomal RNA small subunit methyltransferase A n=1 Tax=Nonlabens ponticola TaxID=2496866 RepID=A0A3S9MWC3_9FLAO|nr:16S rRNA (adenine(1518)-N(6)/adenine(1519)-N(6))-dimethyltransferase RsmA [Nonlabens ponticola]AZQ43498.1 16S rRNA (adenine(1518)-N(6)/adenine(1519)-N(6))-dimethyltransferase RsmA [Nonlabens ponticola]